MYQTARETQLPSTARHIDRRGSFKLLPSPSPVHLPQPHLNKYSDVHLPYQEPSANKSVVSAAILARLNQENQRATLALQADARILRRRRADGEHYTAAPTVEVHGAQPRFGVGARVEGGVP